MEKEKVLFRNLIKNEEKRIRGKLYCAPEDFIVREIPLDRSFIGDYLYDTVTHPIGKEDKFVICTLVKKNISDFNVIENLSNFLGINYDDIGYHGLKDTFGITIQEISFPYQVYLDNLDRLKNRNFKGFFLKNARFNNAPSKLREIWGNHFVIRVNGVEGGKEEIERRLGKFSRENGRFPNFYGHQRFGVRQNNHRIGKELIKRNFEEALKIFCVESNNETKEISNIRKNLKKSWGNWREGYDIIKNMEYFKQEKKILQHLISKETDYIGAINKINLATFFVNSYGSYLFNIILKNLIDSKIEPDYLPAPGYAINLNNDQVKKEYLKVLNKEGIKLEDFKNGNYKFLSYQGRIKEAFYKIEDFDFRVENSSIVLEFSLPMGVYANLFLEHIFENKSKKSKIE